MYSPEVQSRIAVLRQKSVEGELTLEECQEAVRLIRGDRKGAAIASENSKKKTARKEIKSADEMLSELGL